MVEEDGKQVITEQAEYDEGTPMDEFLVTNQHDEPSESMQEVGEEEEERLAPSPKSRHHFTVEEDLCMLRQVVAQNPYGARGQRGQAWDQIEGSLRQMGFDCTTKSCQDRLARLLRTFASEDARRRSICGQTMNSQPEMVELLTQITAMKSINAVSDQAQTNEALLRQASLTISQQNSRRSHGHSTAEVVLTATIPNGNGKRSIANVLPVHMVEEETTPAKLMRALSAADPFVEAAATPSTASGSNKQELGMGRDEIELKRKELEVHDTIALRTYQLEEARWKKDVEVQEAKLRLEEERMELEKERLAFDKEKLEMEKRKQEMDHVERTHLLETLRQQQQILIDLLTKKVVLEECLEST
ncbi:hypothetical protein RvY_11951 [Ramazzottius varieornatus]|uniref:Myb-like domain-containing protein n=1 Tax=Ramazzottius varieornatus TaxID=947166 RepID=A0A1D1VHT0_RAMVA|nr:hypothetical protein RvY_11951 [Ramazzottius varieornatus]